MVEYTKDENYINSIENHITECYLVKPQREIKHDIYEDEFGVLWDKSGADKDIGIVANCLVYDEESLEKYALPDVDEEYIRKQLENLMASPEENFRVASIGFSLFERCWSLMGFENCLCNMLAEPELVHKLLRKICDRNLRIIDIALEYDIDCFHFGDDWGQQKGLIMGVTHWREFIKPYLKEMYDRVKSAGKYISQHSCGDLREILTTDLYEMGLNIYQTFQPEIYTLEYAGQMFGKVAVWGGISTQADLPYKTPEEIKKIVINTAQAFDYTGLIISPTHSIEFDVPPQNITEMIDTFKKGCK
ncbi:MAG: uroporphyrinogen decarboxylase family protein [Acutalibacteraceae bacterium]